LNVKHEKNNNTQFKSNQLKLQFTDKIKKT